MIRSRLLPLTAALALAASPAIVAPSAAAETPPPGGHFTDDDGNIHEGAIEAIKAEEITNGCAPTRYCPDDPVTRGQMAAFLNRALDLTELFPPPRPLPTAGNPSGNGTPASCTSAAVVAAVAAVAGGGGITFD